MRRINFIAGLFCLAMAICTAAFTAEPTFPFMDSSDSQRFISLTKEVRCPVCQGESIAESNAPLANDLRHKVYELILEKKSDEQIKSFLTSRYGNVILLEPPMNRGTWLLWAFPFLALLSIALFLLKKFNKKQIRL